MRSTLRSVTLSFCALSFAAQSLSTAAAAQVQDGSAVVAVRNTVIIPTKGMVTLDTEPAEDAGARNFAEAEKTSRTPENFRQFDAVSKGQIGDAKTLTLRFAASAKLLTIKSTPEFKVEQGGSCVEGLSYTANSTCTLLVRSTPQGPGNRLGKLEITNSAEVKPLFVGLGGYGYSPTISFTPSIISTVPGTYVSGAGIVSGATNVTVDGGDTLYIADTGNSKVESIDSSGTIVNVTANAGFDPTAPISVVVDRSGYIYFTRRAQYYFLNIITSPGGETAYPTGSTSCAVGSTCGLGGANFYYQQLGGLALDPNGTIFLNTDGAAARFVQGGGSGSLEYIPLVTPNNYNGNSTYSSAPLPLAVDSSDTLYTYYNGGSYGKCVITGESYYNAESNIYNQLAVAGTNTCGFSGDGGQARGAQISGLVSQMTFDIAGNLYFSDTLNQRVRRIDGSTGIITTIAGNGSTGYGGDNGPATSASLNTPTGVAVDSQGQVYILSNSATTGAAQVVRKVGVIGALNLGGLAVGTPSAAQTVTLANTGNSQLDFTHVGFSSGNTSDFVIDPNTTSCNFTVALNAGRSCKIGFIFTPGATGARSAVLSITDDTIAGINTIQLSGTGYTTATLAPASFSYASTTVGSATASQTATLTNTGKAVMTISSILISGTGGTSYSDTTTCGTTLAIGASCTISVVFKPTAAGTLAATLTVSDNALGGHQALALTGVGVAAAAKPALAPTSLTFASQAVGSTSAAQTIKLSNTGTAALGVTSIKMAGTNAGDYIVSNNCGTSVAAGGSCTITVSFKPTATGTRSASVSVASSTGTLTAAVTGSAAAAAKAKVALSSMANPMMQTHTLVLAAQVAASSSVKPSGSVQLLEDNRIWAKGALQDGAVTFKITGMLPGTHLLHAVYLGDKNNAGASSPQLKQVIVVVSDRLYPQVMKQ